MGAQTLTQIKAVLAERGLAPRKALGQNFLIDHGVMRKLIEAADPPAGSLVLEIGPGTGVLTDALLERGCRVVACELDRGLAALLRDRFAGESRFTLVEGDCLASKRELAPEVLAALGQEPFRLVANLPYSAATPVMMILMGQPRCLGQFVTIQKEVGDRLSAGPGSRDYGPISVIGGATSRVEAIATLPPECFWPRPSVTSVMVAIRPIDGASVDVAALGAFTHRLFSQRRKQLGSVLGADVLTSAGIDPKIRAENLDVPTILHLFNGLRAR